MRLPIRGLSGCDRGSNERRRNSQPVSPYPPVIYGLVVRSTRIGSRGGRDSRRGVCILPITRPDRHHAHSPKRDHGGQSHVSADDILTKGRGRPAAMTSPPEAVKDRSRRHASSHPRQRNRSGMRQCYYRCSISAIPSRNSAAPKRRPMIFGRQPEQVARRSLAAGQEPQSSRPRQDRVRPPDVRSRVATVTEDSGPRRTILPLSRTRRRMPSPIHRS